MLCLTVCDFFFILVLYFYYFIYKGITLSKLVSTAKALSELASKKGITLLLYVSTVFELESKVFGIESLNFVFDSLSLCVVWALWPIYYIYELVFISCD